LPVVLGLIDRVRLRIHVSMCRNCANVELQILGVRALTTKLFASTLAVDAGNSSQLRQAEMRSPRADRTQ
jgi:hypothetical protein